jgi:Asp-tRNA(Asn)/Glu-tRNA(Gln) amidotransferase A subunit family amidase
MRRDIRRCSDGANGQFLGPLLGIPILLKVSHRVKARPRRLCAKLVQNHIATNQSFGMETTSGAASFLITI